MLIVLAKHETKAEGGQSFVSKQFEQRFSLPSGVKPEKITSSLSKVSVHARFNNLFLASFMCGYFLVLVSFGNFDDDADFVPKRHRVWRDRPGCNVSYCLNNLEPLGE